MKNKKGRKRERKKVICNGEKKCKEK